MDDDGADADSSTRSIGVSASAATDEVCISVTDPVERIDIHTVVSADYARSLGAALIAAANLAESGK